MIAYRRGHGKERSRQVRWLHMAKAVRGHIETVGGVLCPMCFEFGSGEYSVRQVVSAERPCENCSLDPSKHCQCHG